MFSYTLELLRFNYIRYLLYNIGHFLGYVCGNIENEQNQNIIRLQQIVPSQVVFMYLNRTFIE